MVALDSIGVPFDFVLCLTAARSLMETSQLQPLQLPHVQGGPSSTKTLQSCTHYAFSYSCCIVGCGHPASAVGPIAAMRPPCPLGTLPTRPPQQPLQPPPQLPRFLSPPHWASLQGPPQLLPQLPKLLRQLLSQLPRFPSFLTCHQALAKHLMAGTVEDQSSCQCRTLCRGNSKHRYVCLLCVCVSVCLYTCIS